MVANTVETRRGHSLAKAVLDASFDHHRVGDTIRSDAFWVSFLRLGISVPEGDDIERMAVQLGKVSNIIRSRLVK
jgi:hypothetical protein